MFPVCQLRWTFLQRIVNMAISFSGGFKNLQLTDLSKVYFKRYYFVPTFGIQVSHFVHMAIIAALAWRMAALQGEEFHVFRHAH